MAVKDSEELETNESYPLGKYSFRIERTSVPGSTNDKIEAICTDKDGKNARKSIQISSSTRINGWCVEANETEASVYIKTGLNGGVPHPIPTISGTVIGSTTGYQSVITLGGAQAFRTLHGSTYTYYYLSSSPFSFTETITYSGGQQTQQTYYVNTPRMVLDKPVYVYTNSHSTSFIVTSNVPTSNGNANNYDLYSVLYGEVEEEKLVGRFAINAEDGVGPGSDWTDPGDYDPDWEEGDPTHTLYVTVTGALSGRHNDPIVDPSYSYIPSDKDIVKDYGCGGDGGHGGGGGAGASTVVIHKFATNQANSKEVTAIARRHGYGSGGGKGGKGGDGCILVYY